MFGNPTWERLPQPHPEWGHLRAPVGPIAARSVSVIEELAAGGCWVLSPPAASTRAWAALRGQGLWQ